MQFHFLAGGVRAPHYIAASTLNIFCESVSFGYNKASSGFRYPVVNCEYMPVMKIAITEMEIIMAVRLVCIDYARHFSVYRVQSDVARFLRPSCYC
ncbi:hypothetical protein ALC62_03898 [Cyphomyrmex costatus]|uniref:Uncharacterized protein n=1 Tax=Cyphomyrmex costatus TaxID=456900 RepID=A0A151IKS9_9HYME|nr:hypothetical protein ALC62_03898 [Cyphomyrmex costatus]